MDKKYLKDNNLYEAHKQFMRLCEYMTFPRNIEEDDDDEENAPNDGGNQDGEAMPNDNMGSNEDPMGGDEQANQDTMGGDELGDENSMENNGMNNEDPMNGEAPMGNEAPVADDGFVGQQDGMQGFGDEVDDEEVIDVEDLTDAQEKMNRKVNTVGKGMEDVDERLVKLMGALEKMSKMIDKNNKDIQNFKMEFERRNPSQEEKFNLRSLSSQPFTEKPVEYFNKKNNDPRGDYSFYSDNDEPTSQNYDVKQSDLSDFSDRSVEQSFSIDDELNQDIKKIFGL